MIGVDIEIGVSTCMSKALLQLIPPGSTCFSSTPLTGDSLRDMEVDKQVRVGDSLPHSGYIRMLLLDLPGVVASVSEGCHEG